MSRKITVKSGTAQTRRSSGRTKATRGAAGATRRPRAGPSPVVREGMTAGGDAHHRLDLALASARIVSWRWNLWNHSIETSPNFGDIHGVAVIRTAAQKKALIHAEDRKFYAKAFAAAMERGAPFHAVFRMVRPDDGRLVWLEEHGNPVMSPDGRVTAYAGVVMDITERHTAEAALRESELRFRQVMDAIEQVFWMTDASKKTMFYVSPGYERIWARTCQSLYAAPRRWLEAVHPADRARIRAAIQTEQAAGGYDVEYRIVRPDKTERWIRDRAFPIRDSDGKVQRIAGIADDITERKRGELERDRLVRLIEASGDFIATADLEGRITYMNAAGRRMIGLREGGDPRDLHFTDYVAPGWGDFFRQTVIPTAQKEGQWEGEIQLRNLTTGALIDVFRSIFVVSDPVSSVPVCFATVTRDITERKRLERQLLESGERERRQLGHELHDGLGQQLHAVHFMSALLHKNLRDDTSPRAADAARLSKLIHEAITMTRGLARGLQPVSPIPEGLMVALRELAARTRTLYQIDCRLVCQHPVLVATPTIASHLYRIAQEAVNNAVKHARPTRIRILLSEGNGRIVVGVSDNGIGRRRTRRREGLGLRIMHHRADAMAGTLAVMRLPEGGTEVVCSVPYANEPRAGRDTAPT